MTSQNLFIHSPAQSTNRFVQWAEWLQTAPKIDYGCILDKYIIPLHPGEVMPVLARPGHGKSSFMAYLAKRTAKKIVERGEDASKCVLYFSWEQPVEEIEAFFQSGDSYSSTDLAWGRVDLEAVKRQAIKRPSLPVWLGGRSIANAAKKQPEMTIDQIYEGIREMKYSHGYDPILICFDYLQIIPVQGVRDRAQEVAEACYQAKQFAMSVGVPIVVGVQAKRDVDNRSDPMPTLADAQWSSALEQVADKQISLFRPIKMMDKGEKFNIGDKEYTVDEYLLVVKLLKQRFDSGAGKWPLHFKPQTLEVKDYHTHPLNDGLVIPPDFQNPVTKTMLLG